MAWMARELSFPLGPPPSSTRRHRGRAALALPLLSDTTVSIPSQTLRED